MTTDLMMYLVEASICQGICYLFYQVFLKKEPAFRFNRFYMVAVLALSVVAPFMEVPVEKSIVYLPQQAAMPTMVAVPEVTPAAVEPAVAVPVASLSLWQLMFYGYIAISLLVGMRLLYQIVCLYYLRVSGKRQVYKHYTLICTEGKLPTSSFFGWLFWDNSQVVKPEEKELMIEHELVHIAQHHSRDMLFLQLLKVVFWFNPAIYFFEKSLQEVHECLADKGVVKPENAQQYIRLLVEQALIRHRILILHSFNGSLVHKRIVSIKATQKPSLAFWKMGLSVVLVAAILYVQACQPKEATEPVRIDKLAPENTYWLSAHGKVEASNRFKEGEYLFGHYPKPEVDEFAYPVGGFNPYHTYIQNNLREPIQIKPAGIVKKVFVQFTVDTEGNVRNPKVAPGMGLGPGFDEEAIRVIANGPRWVPAKKNGKPVEASMMEAVVFGQRARFSGLVDAVFQERNAVRSSAEKGGPVPVEGVTNLIHKFTFPYPEEAKTQFIEGTVVVGFTVQADGKASGFEVLQPIHPALDREALRTAQAANAPWKPAMKNGKAQASKVLISFGFYLAD
ncbi:TonB family protein [Rhodocytophaga aerolata]|uniref:TonB family protein n=1 Tax=Rhodocytophaga aerolata TaxID=455078 RepID=A0ABT8RH49_9BACT|nr:TonB family protein [Rhodocytophaga aerolata]MDO1451430.1 TonB family protein [Rhodocytophaga aerolata]